jgi:hypothetical protein
MLTVGIWSHVVAWLDPVLVARCNKLLDDVLSVPTAIACDYERMMGDQQ